MKKTPYVTLLLLSYIFIGCSGCDTAIDKAVGSIDRGVDRINKTAVGWQNIVTEIGAELPKEIQQIIGTDINILAKDVIGAGTASVMCTGDFLKIRTVQTLKNLKNRLLTKPYTPTTPGFCTLTYSSLDPNSSSKSVNTLNIYGFDLKSRDSSNNLIKAVLVGKNRRVVIDEDLIGRTTNYQLAINVGGLLPYLVDNEFSKIKLYWNNDTTQMPEILIQEWTAKTKAPEKIPAMTKDFTPPLIGGDADFTTNDGNWADGKVFVEFRIDSAKSYVEARIFMEAMEFGGDNTHVKGYSDWWKIYTIDDKNYEIQSFGPDNTAEQLFSFREHGEKRFHPSGSIAEYAIQIDHPGDDAGSYTKVTAYFNDLQVIKIQKKPQAKKL